MHALPADVTATTCLLHVPGIFDGVELDGTVDDFAVSSASNPLSTLRALCLLT
eukprot:NODE_18659_length_882_cov_4.904636.p8 GENE.NODE_18659_length_882_cov_4.904636~~NODE_18659_length_882_cov_4.904636.p8  ORF type:complete len:53 (-),score=11.39 NODE_18659_length_882_cov_4.904636:218-376(-)